MGIYRSLPLPGALRFSANSVVESRSGSLLPNKSWLLPLVFGMHYG